MPDVGAGSVSGAHIPAVADVAYAGNLTLKVDLTDIDRASSACTRLFRQAGPLPCCIRNGCREINPPRGPIDGLAGPSLWLVSSGRIGARSGRVYAFHWRFSGCQRLD